MLVKDRDALECDLAETYGIYDINALPLHKIAKFAVGLRANSRIKMALSGDKVYIDTFLLAGMFDTLSWLKWAKTEDGIRNINHPKSILAILTGSDKKPESNRYSFKSADDFERVFNN